MEQISDLVNLLSLEQLDTCLFRGSNYKTPWKRVFGGQVLGQALNAAYQTIPLERLAHSLHAYFILAGDPEMPIIYQVEVIRDGGSFSTRRVTGIQKGRPIFVMSASFQLSQEGFNHQDPMPQVISPKGLLTDMEQAELLKDTSPNIYNKIKNRAQNAIEFRPTDQLSSDMTIPIEPNRKVWMKTTSNIKLSLPMQHQLLAFASDYDLLITAIYPHRTEVNVNNLFLASLDHAMWFHRDFDFNDWLLYSINSPSASNSRGMGYGSIYDKKGNLVSTVLQEGLIRLMRR